MADQDWRKLPLDKLLDKRDAVRNDPKFGTDSDLYHQIGERIKTLRRKSSGRSEIERAQREAKAAAAGKPTPKKFLLTQVRCHWFPSCLPVPQAIISIHASAFSPVPAFKKMSAIPVNLERSYEAWEIHLLGLVVEGLGDEELGMISKCLLKMVLAERVFCSNNNREWCQMEWGNCGSL